MAGCAVGHFAVDAYDHQWCFETDSFSGIYDPKGNWSSSGSGAMDIAFVEANSASLEVAAR